MCLLVGEIVIDDNQFNGAVFVEYYFFFSILISAVIRFMCTQANFLL